MKQKPWPTIREIVIKCSTAPDVLVGASVLVSTGKPCVDFRLSGGDEHTLTPAEARRVAIALIKAADCCAAKTAAAKVLRSTPLAQEVRS